MLAHYGSITSARPPSPGSQRLAELDPPLETGDYAELKDPACDIIIVAPEAWADQVNWTPPASDA
jgi:hypothetical protein